MLTVKEPDPRVFEVMLAGVVEASDIEGMRRGLTPALEPEGKMRLVQRMEDLVDVTGDDTSADAAARDWARAA